MLKLKKTSSSEAGSERTWDDVGEEYGDIVPVLKVVHGGDYRVIKSSEGSPVDREQADRVRVKLRSALGLL